MAARPASFYLRLIALGYGLGLPLVAYDTVALIGDGFRLPTMLRSKLGYNEIGGVLKELKGPANVQFTPDNHALLSPYWIMKVLNALGGRHGCGRGHDDQVGLRPVAEQIAEDDQSPERMAEEDNRPLSGRRPHGGHPVSHIGVVIAERIDERPPAGRPAEPAEVEGMDVETGSGELLPDVLVSARVLGQPVDDQDHGPWIPGRLPVT